MDIGNIGQYSIAKSQSQLMNDVAVAVTKLSMDTSKQVGENMVKMMEQSVNPHLGSNIDIKL